MSLQPHERYKARICRKAGKGYVWRVCGKGNRVSY